MGLIEIFALQFPLGVLTALSPCLFPLLPSYLAIISREQSASRIKVFISLLSLLAGLMVVYTLFGLLASVLISTTQFLLRNVMWFAIFQGALLILIGVFMIRTPSFIQNLSTSNLVNKIASESHRQNLPLVSFLIGISFTLIAAPCAASYFLLSWTQAALLPLYEQLLSFALFTVGASIPFIILAIIVPELKTTFIQDLNRSSEIIKVFVGIVVIGSGIWLIWTRLP